MSNRSPILTLLCIAWLAITAVAAADSLGEEPLFLSPTENGWAQPAFVEANLRFEGTATAEADKQPSASVRGRIDLAYEQTGLAADDGDRRVVRKIERQESSIGGLLDGSQLLVAGDGPQGAQLAAVGSALTRAQLDTVQLTADPLDIDAMLPSVPVRDGATWKIDQEAIERIFRVNAGPVCDVVAIVSDVTPGHVRLRFAGPVHGSVDGAAVEIELRGVALFDRSLNRLTKFNLAWKESRAVGPATPAIEATAKLNLVVRPADEAAGISDAERSLALETPSDQRLLVSPRGGWKLLADRDWFVVADGPGATTLRRVQGDDVAAVATLTTRTRTAMTVSQLEQEVRNALGSRLGQVVSTSLGETQHGDPWLTIASVGQDDGQPVQWRHDHVSTGTAAVAVTTTRADGQEDALAEAAVRRLIDSLEPTVPTATASAKAESKRR